MFAIRNLARTAPRSIARLSTRAVRPQPSAFTKVSAFQPAWSQAPRLAAAFHVSAARREDGGGRNIHARCRILANIYIYGAVNEELVAKLQNEISMEEDMKEDEDLSANIKEYLESSPFEVLPPFLYTPAKLMHPRSRTSQATKKSS